MDLWQRINAVTEPVTKDTKFVGTTKLVAGMMRTAVQDCIVKEMWRNPIARTSMSVTQQTDYFLGQNIVDRILFVQIPLEVLPAHAMQVMKTLRPGMAVWTRTNVLKAEITVM
jgi:hypothetical protein